MAVMQFTGNTEFHLKLLASVKQKESANLEETMKRRGRRSLLAGYGVVVYTGRSHGVFSGDEFGELTQRRENQRVQQQILASVHELQLTPEQTQGLLTAIALPT